jgi:hypothetical protein
VVQSQRVTNLVRDDVSLISARGSVVNKHIAWCPRYPAAVPHVHARLFFWGVNVGLTVAAARTFASSQ